MVQRATITAALAAILGLCAPCHVLAAPPPASQPEVSIYVSPAGSDSNPGTLDKPFATISRARDAIRQIRKTGPAGDVTVFLRGGVYTLDKTVTFGPADSAGKDHRITYAAYADEKPIISGAPLLKAKWERPDPRGDDHVWSAQLPKGTWFQELFVNGKRQPRARIPATGFIKAIDLDQSRTEFGFDPKQVHVHDTSAARMIATIRTYQWHEQHLPVASLDASKGRVKLAREAGYPIVPKGYGVAGEFAIENLADAIAGPGQWSLDASGLLCYWPADGVDPAKAEVRGATTVVLFDLCGDSRKKQLVENLHFRGLTFTQAGRIERLEWGAYEGQAIRMQQGVANCSIRDCKFVDLGGGGVVLWRDCQNVEIDGNEFAGIGDTPVFISSYLGEGPSDSGNNRITNNRIHDCATVRRNACAIEMSMTEGNVVAHNLIYDMPYIGIRLSGAMPTSWQQKSVPSLSPPFTAEKIKPFVRSRNNRVEFNHIHHVMQTLADGGAIYFWGTMGEGANKVTGNLIEDVGRADELAVGIYMDDYCDDVIIRDNVVLRANWGLHLHGAPRITIENNIFAFTSGVDCSIQPEKYNTSPMGSVIRRNIFYMGTGKLTHDWTDWKKQPISEMNFNCWWRAEGKLPTKPPLGFGQGFDKDSIIADPLFADPTKPQAGSKPDSPAIKLGFKPIDMSNVGPTSQPQGEVRVPPLP